MLRYFLSILLALSATIGVVRAQGFNPDNPPEPMTQKMVRIIAELAEGVASITTGGYFTIGTILNVHVSTNSEYEFLYWKLNGHNHTESTYFDYTVGDSAVTFTAMLKKKPVVSVSVSPAGAGSVSGGGVYTPGTSHTISTSANSGYTFQYWLLNGEQYSDATSFSYTVQDEDASFVAVYTVTPEAPFDPSSPAEPMANYHVSVQTDLPNGFVPISISESGYYSVGENINVSIVPPTEYVFEYWTHNGQYYTSNASFSYTIGTDNEIFVAHCTAKKQVSVSCMPAGTAVVSGGGYYATNTKILLTAVPNAGYKFVCWKLDEMRYSEAPSFYYIVGSLDVSFLAVFEEDSEFNPDSPEEEPFIPSNPSEPNTEQAALLITVLVNDTALGSVSGLPTTPLFAGDQITLTATPSCDGYYFQRWSDSNTDNPRTITLTTDAIYTAVFAKRQYTITFYDEDGSTILDQRLWEYGATPSCISPAKADDANYSYRFDTWQPAVTPVTQSASYTASYEATPLQPSPPTDVDELIAEKPAYKLLHNGTIFILRGNKIYTLQGQEIK